MTESKYSLSKNIYLKKDKIIQLLVAVLVDHGFAVDGCNLS